MPAAAIAPIAGLAGSAISGIFGNSAASAQADAAKNAAAMQMQQAAQTQRVSDLNRQDQFPWLATGTNAINTLSHLMGVAGGTSNAPWAPTYAGATPGAPSPFMVRSANGGNGTIAAGNASNLRPTPQSRADAERASFESSFNSGGKLYPSTYGSNDVQNVAGTNDPVRGAPGSILPNGQGATNGMMTPNGATDTGQQFGGPPQPGNGTLDMGAAGTAMAQGGGAGQPAAPQAGVGDPTAGMSGDGSLAQGWTQAFNAPDNLTEQNDPGFQARMKMGTDALQNSAAARGNLLTGGTAKDLSKFGQDYASNEYGNVYNRALGQYQQNYNIFQNNQANLFNRLSALSGGGQVSAANIGGGALQAAGQIGQSVQAAGNDLQNAAYQRGSGYVNTGNAISGGLNNLGALASVLKNNNNNIQNPW